VAQGPSAVPSQISLERGAIHPVPVHNVTRVAIGNPDIVDVTIVSVNEVLLQAKAFGTTNLILWDEQGQTTTMVEVVDPTTEAIATQLRQVIQGLGLSSVQVRREEDKIFLTGEVSRQEDLERIEQMLAAYDRKVTNLVTLPAVQAPPAVPPPTVQLTVQLVEMSRDDTNNFGVDWSDSTTFTETPFGALGPQGVSMAARLGEAFRWGALSRGGLSAKLNLLVTQGKARILAEPKLVAASGSEATATLGVEVPIITATNVSSGTVTQNIEFKQTGVELKFTPTVLENQRSIRLVVDSKVSTIDKTNAITVSGIVVPGFKVRHAQTEIVTDSGETILITGLLQDEDKKNLSQLPGMGSIPVLGNLFRSTEFTQGKTELVIMVTPELRADAASSVEHSFALEEALAGAEAPPADDPALRYALQIQDRVAKAIRYPAGEKEKGIGGRVKLRLHLFRDGTLEQAVISEPSGIEVFDTEALTAVQSQAPYPPFPSELPQQDLWLEFPVLFKP
jgi:pilus assembly protein CpaC